MHYFSVAINPLFSVRFFSSIEKFTQMVKVFFGVIKKDLPISCHWSFAENRFRPILAKLLQDRSYTSRTFRMSIDTMTYAVPVVIYCANNIFFPYEGMMS